MRIKVTGYIESEDLPGELVDDEHDMGLSDEGYEQLSTGVEPFAISDLNELEFKAVSS